MNDNDPIREFCYKVMALAENNDIPGLEKLVAFAPKVFSYRLDPETTRNSCTVLQYCSADSRVQPATLRFILDHGGKEAVNTPNSEGHTPLFHAKRYRTIRNKEDPANIDRRQETVDLLKEYGADDSLKALRGATDLHFAVMNQQYGTNAGSIETAAMKARLREHPEEVFMRDAEGNTPPDYITKKPQPRQTHVVTTGHQDVFEHFLKPALALYHPEHGGWLANQKWIYIKLAQDIHDNIPTENGFLAEIFKHSHWQGHEEAALALRDDMLHYSKTPPVDDEWFFAGSGQRESLQRALAAIDFAPFERAAAGRAGTTRENKFTKALKKPAGAPDITPGGKG